MTPGRTIVTRNRQQCTIVVKDVPAEICVTCGEYYLDESVTEELLRRADSAARNGAVVEILAYAA